MCYSSQRLVQKNPFTISSTIYVVKFHKWPFSAYKKPVTQVQKVLFSCLYNAEAKDIDLNNV